MNGPDFLTLCEEYIKAINEGTIPDIPDAWTSVVEVQCKQAVEKSLELYIRKMEELEHRIPLTADDLLSYHSENQQAALNHFQSVTKGIP